MNELSLTETMRKINKLNDDNKKCTMLGIGPMSENLIRASFLLAKKKDFPLMFIASRNQVDADEFGGGYVCSWNQDTFARDIKKIADELSFKGLYYLCRDHGGPWQRDRERNEKLPVPEAMELGKRSYVYDLKAGFDLLHIDPTKMPTEEKVVPMNFVLDATVELIEFCETQRKKMNLAAVAYEVGTEETNGGTTDTEGYSYFINALTSRLGEKDLPLPLFIVGNTGTLTRLTENVGKYDFEQAMKLSKIAKEHGLGLKEHNGDYLSDYFLGIHPAIGIAATNVAPEYGVAETRALLLLSKMECYFRSIGLIENPSCFNSVFTDAAIGSERWRKWMIGDKRSYSSEEVKKDKKTAELIVDISGHYTFNNETVKAEIKSMYANLEKTGVRPGQIVINEIIKSIERYVDYFNLEGITSLVMGRF
jgi:tagatose-1,6-bisphosphate aldolase non-catalytic subunit AgaZ/GatZ